MSYNDDPIKEYTPFRLGLDNLEDNIKTANEYIDRDLHDCSDDLSDRGSVLEEIEHVKFVERARKANAAYNRAKFDASRPWNKSPVKTKSNNVFSVIVFILIFLSLFGEIVFEIINGFENITENTIQGSYQEESNYFDITYNDSYNSDIYNYDLEYESTDFETYKGNISIQEHNSPLSNNVVLELYNRNDTSFSNIVIQTDFYDKNNIVIYTAYTYINMLIGNNVQFFEILETPSEYYRMEHTYINEYAGKNYAFDTYTGVTVDYVGETITIENNVGYTIDMAQVVVVYFDNYGKVNLESYYFNEIADGEKVSEVIYSEYLESANVGTVSVVLNDICIY